MVDYLLASKDTDSDNSGVDKNDKVKFNKLTKFTVIYWGYQKSKSTHGPLVLDLHHEKLKIIGFLRHY